MEPGKAIIAIVVGYAIGALSWARIVAHIAAPGRDLTQLAMDVEGSDVQYRITGVNSSSVSMQLGPRWGFCVMLGDMLKVIGPILAIRWAYPQAPYYLLTHLAGVCGHIWPAYYRFRGGRGLASLYGGLLAIDPVGMFATFFGGILLGLVVLRNAALAYFAGAWLLAPWLWFIPGLMGVSADRAPHDWRYLAYAVSLNSVAVLGMIPDIRQILAFRRMGIAHDPNDFLARTAMGRGMLKMARLFGMPRTKH